MFAVRLLMVAKSNAKTETMKINMIKREKREKKMPGKRCR